MQEHAARTLLCALSTDIKLQTIRSFKLKAVAFISTDLSFYRSSVSKLCHDHAKTRCPRTSTTCILDKNGYSNPQFTTFKYTFTYQASETVWNKWHSATLIPHTTAISFI